AATPATAPPKTCAKNVEVLPATAGGPSTTVVTFTVRVDETLPANVTEISNFVTTNQGNCQQEAPECTASNPTPAVLQTKKELALVNGAKAGSGQTVQPGDVLTYDITITNSGGPTTLALTERVPANTTYAGPEGDWEGCVLAPSPTAPPKTCAKNVE